MLLEYFTLRSVFCGEKVSAVLTDTQATGHAGGGHVVISCCRCCCSSSSPLSCEADLQQLATQLNRQLNSIQLNRRPDIAGLCPLNSQRG